MSDQLQAPVQDPIEAALGGDRIAWGKVLGMTLSQSLMMAPGLWLVGFRGVKLISASVAGSISLTAILFAIKMVQRKFSLRGVDHVPLDPSFHSNVADGATASVR